MAPGRGIYGQKTASKKTAGASDAIFGSTLTALLASAATEKGEEKKEKYSRGRRSAEVRKDDNIFSRPNKGIARRAQADLQETSGQKHATSSEDIDAATRQRVRRKMEEKARLYASMQRGDYVPPVDAAGRGVNRETEALVDFDRKWAERQAVKDDGDGQDSSNDYSEESSENSDSGYNADRNEIIEYLDELGRTRKGTRAEVARFQRQQRAAQYAQEELSSYAARPSRPANIIVGDTIQAAAFNPDAPVAMQMEDLARKRDRSMTPPEEMHYDATTEIRSKGVGFYQFSKDNEIRQEEMRSLEREREQTEQQRAARDERARRKTEALAAKKQKLADMRSKRQADAFLSTLEPPAPS